MTFVVVVLKAVNDSVLTKSTLRHSKYGEFDSSTVFGRSEKGRLKSNSTVECVVRSLFAETVPLGRSRLRCFNAKSRPANSFLLFYYWCNCLIRSKP